VIEVANQAKAKIEEAFKKSGAPAADARAFANAAPEDLQRLQQAVEEANQKMQDQTDRIAQYNPMMEDVARRQEADVQVAKMQYELVKQQAQAAEGVSDRTVDLVRGMMQDAAAVQARQMKDSMDAVQAKMDVITSKERFAAPEASAQRLDAVLKTTAATLGQVQADRDKLSTRESSIIQREAEIGRREATITKRDKQVEQRLAFAVNEAEQEKRLEK
jgi:hypothetical protein